jgi:hypothetical protein
MVAGYFIPAKRRATRACPLRLLPGEPTLYAAASQFLQMLQHLAVVHPAITLKSLDATTGKVVTQPAVQDVVPVGTRADVTVGAAGMDIQRVRAAALAGITRRTAAAAARLVQQMPTVWKSGAKMIAGAASPR